MKYLTLDTAGAHRPSYQQQVKEANIKRIFDLVRCGRCKSRAELVREMKLSATSVSVLVEELTARGLIHETGPKLTSMPGRRPISLRLNSDAHQLAVFTLQRDGVRYALLDMDCSIIESLFVPVESSSLPEADAGDDYAALIEDVLDHRASRFDRARTLALGISFPGIYVPDDRLFRNYTALGINFSEDSMFRLRDRVGLPVYLFNGTKCMAYAEKKRIDAENSAGPETLDMLFVEIQNRIDCAIIAKGNLYTGPHNMSGEIGHFTIDYNGRPCICGNTGCLERYVNRTAILDDARRAAEGAGLKPPESMEELGQRFPDEPALAASVSNSARLLSFGLYSIMCSSGIRRIVLGGCVKALGDPFLREVYRALCSRAVLINRLDLSYAQAGPDDASVGLAQHFLDKIYTITI